MMTNESIKIGIIGLGYVGLPLAVLFAEKYKVIGFDINEKRINELLSCEDSTMEMSGIDLKGAMVDKDAESEIGLFCTAQKSDLRDCNYYIITVPTPVDKNKHPVFLPLKNASKTVGEVLKKGDIVVYESTVYPGATEEVCVPILEKQSSLVFNEDFFAGYSPERINPGDKVHTIDKVVKITSGSTPESAKKIDDLYCSVVSAGTHLASSIKVAEAAKVIENAQRDINIAFVNELAKIFNLIGVETQEVLEAAQTKWNFMPFQPGLVGGHCIGVDPYYLAQKAQEEGYHPEMILAGRRLNDGMGEYVASQVVKLMLKNDMIVKGAKVLVLGITFKENCPDVRNTKVVDLIRAFESYGLSTDIYDPWVDSQQVKKEYNLDVQKKIPEDKYEAIVLAVAHREFLKLELSKFKKKKSVVYDVKSYLPKNQRDLSL